jgi:hypothetical protein
MIGEVHRDGTIAGSWSGTFRFFEDAQCIGVCVSCSDFMLTLDGVWWPIDWYRFRDTHPEEWTEIRDLVVERRRARAK